MVPPAESTRPPAGAVIAWPMTMLLLASSVSVDDWAQLIGAPTVMLPACAPALEEPPVWIVTLAVASAAWRSATLMTEFGPLGVKSRLGGEPVREPLVVGPLSI